MPEIASSVSRRTEAARSHFVRGCIGIAVVGWRPEYYLRYSGLAFGGVRPLRAEQLPVDAMQVFGVEELLRPVVTRRKEPLSVGGGLRLGRRGRTARLAAALRGNPVQEIKVIHERQRFDRESGCHI